MRAPEKWRAGKAEAHGTKVYTDTGGSVAWCPAVSSSEAAHCVSAAEAHRRAVLMASAPDLLDENERLRAQIGALTEVATGFVPHKFMGLCPDSVAGFDSRDPNCKACRVLINAKGLAK